MDLQKIKLAKTKYAVSDNISKRWSPRTFNENLITHEQIMTLFEAATWAPSCYNEQPWQFVYATRDQDGKFALLNSFMGEFNQKWASNAAMLVVGIYKKTFTHNGNPNKHAAHDLGMASATLALQATHMGLHAHFMGGFDAALAAEKLNLSADYEALTMFAVGYLGTIEETHPDFAADEQKPRTRKALNTSVFNDVF